MKKETLVERILARLTGGDKAKLSRFSAKLEKYFTAQIRMRNESIDKLKDKIIDAEEILADAILDVNTDSIKSVDDSEAYVVKYIASISAKRSAIETLKDSIEELEAGIEELEATQKAIFGEA